jgi:hypothetical protein
MFSMRTPLTSVREDTARLRSHMSIHDCV